MQPFEYLLLLAAVILGLAIADLAISLNRLLRAGRKVKWDWLAPLAALVAMLKIVTQWWGWYQIQDRARGATFEMFVWVLIVTLLLFLLASASLPDETPAEGIDLKAYFDKVARYYFTLFVLHGVGSLLVGFWAELLMDGHIGADLMASLPRQGAIIAACVSAIVIRNRLWRGACLLSLAGFYLWQGAGTTLSG